MQEFWSYSQYTQVSSLITRASLGCPLVSGFIFAPPFPLLSHCDLLGSGPVLSLHLLLCYNIPHRWVVFLLLIHRKNAATESYQSGKIQSKTSCALRFLVTIQ